MTDHYTLLGVSRSAASIEIQSAFRALASRYHPDKPGGDGERMKELNVAYATLMDREQRASYDATLPWPAGAQVLACVSAVDYADARGLRAFGLYVGGELCVFCDGAREVRVGLGGFWERRPCPLCCAPVGAEGS